MVVGFILAVTIYVTYYGENIYIQVHDNLDSNIAWLKMLKDNHLFWTHGTTVPFLGGMNRNNLYSELKVYSWLYMIFPVFTAYIIGYILKIILAVSGSVYLGKTLLKDKMAIYSNVIVLCGFLYGILPTFTTSAFYFASLPFLLGILYRLYETGNKKFILLLFLYPLISYFTSFGIFICGYLFLFIIIDGIINKKINWKMFGGLIALAAGYVITEYRLFYVMLFSGETTIRASMKINYLSVNEVCREIIEGFRLGHYHSGSLHQYVVFPICMFYWLILNIHYLRKKEIRKLFCDRFNWIIIWIFFNAVVYGLNDFEPFKKMVAGVLPILSGFSMARTLWFNPFLWCFAFAIVLCRMMKRKWHIVSYVMCFISIIVIFVYPSEYNHIAMNIQNRIALWQGESTENLTYEEFYSEDLFENIKQEINYHGEYAVAFGMHPAILNYNGIATLDGYYSNYSQEYKDQFRKLLAPEFEIDENNQMYFDNWGGRAYLFSTEIEYAPVHNMVQQEADLLIDTKVFEKMGGKYIFSRVKIRNAENLELGLIGCYQNQKSPYVIYVYE